jgi:hypothetical protein
MCVWALLARLREQQRDTERPPARAGKRRREIVEERAKSGVRQLLGARSLENGVVVGRTPLGRREA